MGIWYSNGGYLLLIAVAFVIILAVGIDLVIRKRSKGDEEDEPPEDGMDSEVVRSEESRFPEGLADQEEKTPPDAKAGRIPPSYTVPTLDKKGGEKLSVEAIMEQVKKKPSTITPLLPREDGTPTTPPALPPPSEAPIMPDEENPPSTPRPTPSGPQLVGVESEFTISDIFLIYVDGRLVTQVSPSSQLREEMDEDIMSGMLTAITDFIKDSFSDEQGALKTLQYGKMNIYIERGVTMFLAVVFRGQPPQELRQKMRWLLIRLWEKYKTRLKVWDGSPDGLDGLDTMLKGLMGQTEPTEALPEAPVAPEKRKGKPEVSTADKAITCGICMGVVKPGLEILTCSCGKRYHRTCGERVDRCPGCGTSLDISNFEMKPQPPPKEDDFHIPIPDEEGEVRDVPPLPPKRKT